jgi:hypothetical protein
MEANRLDPWERIERLVGVYEANGGLIGEMSYVVGKVTGRAHCALCDITHSPWRRKPEWDRFTGALPVPFELVHLNERDELILAGTSGFTPCVVAVLADQQVQVLVSADDLEAAGGSIDRFADVLRVRVLDLRPPQRSEPVVHP